MRLGKEKEAPDPLLTPVLRPGGHNPGADR